MAKEKGIGMEERSVKEAKLSDIEMDNVTLVELVDFVKRIYPAVAKSVIKDVFPELVGQAVQAALIEEQKEYMVLVKQSPCNFVSPMTLSISTEGLDFGHFRTDELKVVKQCVDEMLAKQVDTDDIYVVSIESKKQLRNVK